MKNDINNYVHKVKTLESEKSGMTNQIHSVEQYVKAAESQKEEAMKTL